MIWDIISLVIVLIGIILFIVEIVKSRYNTNTPHPVRNKKAKWAFLIPARDESNVINSLLKSIKMQTKKVNMNDVYIIVETMNDKTVDIANKYGCTIVVRNDLTKQRKGYALDDAVKYIFSNNKRYDLYFVVDADNVLESNFTEEMLKQYFLGYDLCTCYRDNKNPVNTVSICSALTFTIINTVINTSRVKHKGNVIISGTGFYIKGKLIDKWRGFPFHTLTEDYEMTLYSKLNGLNTTYITSTSFKDDQPTKYQQSIVQRTRWVKGFIEARSKYIYKLKNIISSKNRGSIISAIIGVIPYVIMIIGVVLCIGSNLFTMFYHIPSKISLMYLYKIIFVVVIVYILLSIITLILLNKEKKRWNIRGWKKTKVILFNPIFLLSYIRCALLALFMKEVKWSKIKHE